MLTPMRLADRCPRLVVLLGWMALIAYWSSQNNLPIDQPFVADLLLGLQHRLAHILAFGLMALLARWAFDGLPRAALLAVLLVSVFGATDEWHQSFTPGRRPGIDDWATDTAAAAMAVYTWSRVHSVSAGRWLRALAPVVVGAAFVVGIGLALWPNVATHAEPTGSSLRTVTAQAARGTLTLVRSTRDLARHLRSTLTS